MWAILIGVPAGKLVASQTKSAVAEVIAPVESLVRLKVMFAVPRPLASALLTAGTSFDGSKAAVNLTVFEPDGVVGVVVPQPTARMSRIARTDRRFIVFLLNRTYGPG